MECGETSTQNTSIDTRNLVKTLAGEVEANELTDVSRVEAKRNYGSDCTEDVSFAPTVESLDCHLLIASGI